MAGNKYFYEGIPLSKYCKDHDIKLSTITARIWKKKQNKKYENYTDQEIVNLVMKTRGGTTKYMYQGISLRQYCLENELNPKTIESRIHKLKNENKNFKNDDLVKLALEEFDNKNFKFFYKGIPLKQYCEEHPEINYNTIRSFINTEKTKTPTLSDEKIIEQYLAKEHKGIYRYYYLGIPLKQYCDENNLNHRNIITYMSRHRNDETFADLKDDEFVEAIINQYQPFEPKYIYKGITLSEYCKQNNLSYYSVVSYIKRKLVNGNAKNIDELIDEAINTINRYGIIYYYKGIPLKDYAKQNGLNASSIRSAILRKKATSDKQLQEIIDECVESYQKFSIKYYYKGIPLFKYCQSIGLNYNTVIHKYLYEYEDTDTNIDEAIKQIVDYYIEHPPIKTKYYFNNQSLTNFCDANGYTYFAIQRRIRKLQSKNILLNNDEIITTAIKKYEDKLQIDKINETFDKLKSLKSYDINEIKEICEFLKIDFENVNELVNMDFTFNQAINLIWYFSDKKTSNDFKIITDKKIEDIFILINALKKSDQDIEQFELYDLIGIYKSKLYDSRKEILLREKRYICKTIYSLCNSYNITLNKNNYEEFESEIKYYLLLVINRTNLNVKGQVIKYMDLTVKGYFRTYLKSYIQQNRILSLDDAKYSSDKGTRKEKTMIDTIADSKNNYEENKNTSFSSTMMDVLSSLSKEDLSFIMLKYQEDYSDEELASFLNLTIDEIKKKEIEILSLLKRDENLKLLKMSKNDN